MPTLSGLQVRIVTAKFDIRNVFELLRTLLLLELFELFKLSQLWIGPIFLLAGRP